MTQEPDDDAHRVPAGTTEETVRALGKLSEALETTERARGSLYDFHQLTGHADFMLDEAIDLLRQAGHDDAAQQVRERLVGRNVLAGRWTFEVVEEYDDGYMDAFRAVEREIRHDLADGRRHLHEARLKEQRRGDAEPL